MVRVDYRLTGFSGRVFLAALGALCGACFGQTLTGKVTWDGHPVAGARVTLAAQGQRVMTDGAGNYSLGTTAIGPGKRNRIPLAVPYEVRTSTVTYADPASGTPRRGDGRAEPGSGDPRTASPDLTFVPGFAQASAPKSTAAQAPIEVVIQARGYLTRRLPLPPGQTKLDAVLERDYRRHLWVWEAGCLTNAALRDSLLAFGKQKGIGTYYMNAGGVLGTKDAALAAFLDTAEARGYAVELLFGEPEWALTAQHGEAVGLAEKTKALAASQDAKLRAVPTAIQFDVEPYSMADTAGIGTQWVDMYLKASAALKGTGVGVTACVPRWLDGRMVLRGGRTRPLSEWIADASDRMTLMDYVDKAKGILDGAVDELTYADAIGKEVAIGVETIAGLDPPSVSFAEEGEAALEAALAANETEFRKHPSYFGAAIHHWRAYEILKP